MTQLIVPSRRRLIASLGASLLCAPAIVRASSLMAISPLTPMPVTPDSEPIIKLYRVTLQVNGAIIGTAEAAEGWQLVEERPGGPPLVLRVGPGMEK